MSSGLRAAAAVGIIVVGLLGRAHPAAACTCVAGPGEVAWPTLDQAASKADAVLIGRVLARQTLSDPPPYDGNDVAYVDLEVVDGIKGLVSGAHIRVWDGGFGSSCTTDLRPLVAGRLVAMAVAHNSPEYREYQEMMRLKVAAEDYLLWPCGDYMQILDSNDDASKAATRFRKAVMRPSKGRRTTR
jgi:hypothetical protein